MHEWWYVNSHLEGSSGRRYGFVTSFFPDYVLGALVDKGAKRTIGKGVDRRGRLLSTPRGIRIGGCALQGAGRGVYGLNYVGDGFSADLTLRSEKPPLLVNGSGEIREGLLGRSWYYALTRMSVGGELKTSQGGDRVSGVGWMDRQWGGWDDMGIGGWEWFSLQFSNRWEVLATQIYSPVTMKTCFRVMSIKKPDSAEVHTSAFSMRRLSEWKSPETGKTYGSSWELRGPAGGKIRVGATFDSQEIHAGFWEGSCEAVLDAGTGEVPGMGYSEQVLRNEGRVTSLLSFAAAPVHYAFQRALGRTSFHMWDLAEKLGVWKLSPPKR